MRLKALLVIALLLSVGCTRREHIVLHGTWTGEPPMIQIERDPASNITTLPAFCTCATTDPRGCYWCDGSPTTPCDSTSSVWVSPNIVDLNSTSNRWPQK